MCQVIAEEPEDMWHLYNMIAAGDRYLIISREIVVFCLTLCFELLIEMKRFLEISVTASTIRKVYFHHYYYHDIHFLFCLDSVTYVPI